MKVRQFIMKRYVPVKKEKNQRKGADIAPGTYDAVVISVESPEGFVEGQAIDVTYEICIDNGVTYHTERFLIADFRSPRTREFEAFLDSIGAEAYEDLVGLEFELTFKYEVKAHKTWCNIVERKLLTSGEEDAGNSER